MGDVEYEQLRRQDAAYGAWLKLERQERAWTKYPAEFIQAMRADRRAIRAQVEPEMRKRGELIDL